MTNPHVLSFSPIWPGRHASAGTPANGLDRGGRPNPSKLITSSPHIDWLRRHASAGTPANGTEPWRPPPSATRISPLTRNWNRRHASAGTPANGTKPWRPPASNQLYTEEVFSCGETIVWTSCSVNHSADTLPLYASRCCTCSYRGPRAICAGVSVHVMWHVAQC